MKTLILSFLKSKTFEKIMYTVAIVVAINYISVSPLKQQLSELTEAYTEIAKQPKYAIQNDFEKMRTNKEGDINLNVSSDLQSAEIKEEAPEEKKRFFKRIFKKK